MPWQTNVHSRSKRGSMRLELWSKDSVCSPFGGTRMKGTRLLGAEKPDDSKDEACKQEGEVKQEGREEVLRESPYK